MTDSQSRPLVRRLLLAGLIVVVTAMLMIDRTRSMLQTLVSPDQPPAFAAARDDSHTDHDHEDVPGADPDQLDLSAAAMKNLGLTEEMLTPVTLTTWMQTIEVPGVVVSHCGRTQLQVSAPLTGVITRVHAVEGEAVVAGAPLFEMRLTHEDLVDSQTEFLQALGELDLEHREIERLESATESGAVAGRMLLERRYQAEKLQAMLVSLREALELHGLSTEQIDEIASRRRLIKSLQIVAPDVDQHRHAAIEHDADRVSSTKRAESAPAPRGSEHGQTGGIGHPISEDGHAATGTQPPLVIEHLNVVKGQAVLAGEALCSLMELSRLSIEGQAFDQDAHAIQRVLEHSWSVTAAFPVDGRDERVADLPVLFIGNTIDADSQTLPFYVDLPNTLVRDETTPDGQRFVTWKHRPGQRVQLRVPVRVVENQIVLPIDAVVRDGAEWVVFRRTATGFRRVCVHVRHRDQLEAVLANDGAINPGNIVALTGAHQMLLALKNKSGSGVDPHAGHSH